MPQTLRVLHVEDSEQDAALLKHHLLTAGYDVVPRRVQTKREMHAALETQEWDVILCDYAMPNFNALAALASLKETGLDIPFIVISGTVGEGAAVEAMRAGAQDYLMKGNLARLAPTIEREIQEAGNRRARRQAEAELLTSEAQYRRLLDTANEGIWVFDTELNTKYVNQRLAELLGVSAQAMIGHHVSDYLDADSLADVEHRWQLREEGIKEHYDLRLRRKDGSELWVIASATPIYDERGEFTGALSMLTDITERKRVEEVIRIQAAALQSAANAILITDSEGTITFANAAFTALSGYSPEEILGRNPRIFKSGEHDKAFYETLWSTIISGRVWRGEMVNRRKDGTLYFEEQTITPLMNDAGEVILFIAIKQDVTERRRAERELQESAERYRDLFDNANDLIYTHDLDGNFTSVNTAAEQLSGYTREEAVNLNIADIMSAEQLKLAKRTMEHQLAGETPPAYELEFSGKDGRSIVAELNTRLIYRDGKPVGVQGIARDITARKQLEDQLRQSQKMEAIGQLAGGVAHDFNNMLMVISGYSELAILKLKAGDPLLRYLEEIRKAWMRGAALTRQLLAFSRKQVLQPRILDLNLIISDLRKMLGRLIGEDLELRAVLHPELGRIKADPGQIEQVIMNLVVNARDAMPRGGKLTIETTNTDLDAEYAGHHANIQPGPYVMLAVSDTGIGMDEKTRERIFEPFFTTKEAGKGTGLGLSTVYGIVKQSGGNILVYSEVGKGTSFKIYLPRVGDAVQDKSHTVRLEKSLLGTETLLLAEDEEPVRNMAREALETYGYQVLEAANGGAALLMCERHNEPIPLLITDVVMPEMSGPELSARLIQLHPEMRVLYMSGYTESAIFQQEILDPGIAFLQKPFTPDDLARKVREVLDAGR
jgi:PAS domain S-box-containing protein